jgi:hypothetical protein
MRGGEGGVRILADVESSRVGIRRVENLAIVVGSIREEARVTKLDGAGNLVSELGRKGRRSVWKVGAENGVKVINEP